MTHKILFYTLALFLFLKPNSFAQKNLDELVAVVGLKKITLKEFNEKYAQATKYAVNLPTILNP